MPGAPSKQIINRFLATHLGASAPEFAALGPLGGDASQRRYFRLGRAEIAGSARVVLLMISPPDSDPLQPFLDVAAALARLGLSAPRIYAADVDSGLALIEDFGDQTYARLLAQQPDRLQPLILAAVDVIVHLYRKRDAISLAAPKHDSALMQAELQVFLDWYPACKSLSNGQKQALLAQMADCLAPVARRSDALVLADFHRDNLMWLPDKNGLAQVGLLDFQDALWGHPLYDLVSLLEDARYDTPESVKAAALTHFRQQLDLDLDGGFETHWALLGMQRHLRILGFFYRLRDLYQKPSYMAFVPRVASQAAQALAHPALAPLAADMRRMGVDLGH